MPKVGGRHFAYTPEGRAAAERYKQSIGMHTGGLMYPYHYHPHGEPGADAQTQAEQRIGVDYGNDPATMGMTWPELLRYQENTQNLADLPPLGFAGLTVGRLAEKFGLPAVNRAIAERQRQAKERGGYAEGAGRDIFTNPNAAEVLGRIPLPTNVPANIYEGGAGYSGQHIKDLERARSVPFQDTGTGRIVPVRPEPFDLGSRQDRVDEAEAAAAAAEQQVAEASGGFANPAQEEVAAAAEQQARTSHLGSGQDPGMFMAGGGMLGFRPLGYADGDLVEEYVYPDKESRQNAIDFIATMTQAGDATIGALLGLSDSEIRRAYLKVMEDTEAGKYDHVVLPDDIRLPQQIPQRAAPAQLLGAPADISNLGRMAGAGDSRISDRDLADISNLIPSPLVATGMGRRFAQERQLDEEGPGNFPMNYPSPLQRNRGGIASLRRY